MASDNMNTETIRGRYSYIGNPCTTDPCLPGMAYAVLSDDKYYYLTVNDCWFSENHSWGEYTPEPNDIVVVKGQVREEKDVFGKFFHTIEVTSLEKEK